ncbi:MAG: RcnB family protein [Pseudomonadota bacterium]
MNFRRTTSLVLATLMAASSVAAIAQDRGPGRDDNRGDRGRPGNAQKADQRGPQHGPQDRGAGPDHNFRKGGRLPAEYRNKQYVVNDWRSHRLSAPPRGYQWVQTGGDYVLVAVATGLIAQILLNQ